MKERTLMKEHGGVALMGWAKASTVLSPGLNFFIFKIRFF